ncbi:MAG: hypothetical protein K0R47_4990, partial [Brevibacillus sp.]|nr:hypothetical protein [Brevibacillus sp.]
QRHLTSEAAVITGKNVNKVYSYLFPEFNASQIEGFYKIAKDSSLVKNRFEKAFHSQKLEMGNVAELIRKANQPMQLLFKKDCQSFSNVDYFSTPKKYEKKIIDAFRDDFGLPWIACTTLNHSVRKTLVEEIGGFDEDFIGHGLEDYEYGFRLFQAGVKFSYDPSIYVYHQEHPIEQYWEEDGTKNLIRFQEKHPWLDVCLLSLSRINMLDYPFMDRILKENRLLSHDYPDKFESFRDALCAMLKQIPVLKAEGKPVTNLLQAAGSGEGPEWNSNVWLERSTLESHGYANVTKLFDLLVRL